VAGLLLDLCQQHEAQVAGPEDPTTTAAPAKSAAAEMVRAVVAWASTLAVTGNLFAAATATTAGSASTAVRAMPKTMAEWP
jgi:hypothetical protein